MYRVRFPQALHLDDWTIGREIFPATSGFVSPTDDLLISNQSHNLVEFNERLTRHAPLNV